MEIKSQPDHIQLRTFDIYISVLTVDIGALINVCARLAG